MVCGRKKSRFVNGEEASGLTTFLLVIKSPFE